jgi:hypothetical protein
LRVWFRDPIQQFPVGGRSKSILVRSINISSNAKVSLFQMWLG